MGYWNFADVWEAVADALPDAPAQIQAERTFRWRDFDGRANAFAAELRRIGLGRSSKIAVLLYNGPEWLEVVFGAFKVSMIPVVTLVSRRFDPAELWRTVASKPLRSREAVGMAGSLAAGDASSDTAQFVVGERANVFTENGRRSCQVRARLAGSPSGALSPSSTTRIQRRAHGRFALWAESGIRFP